MIFIGDALVKTNNSFTFIGFIAVIQQILSRSV